MGERIDRLYWELGIEGKELKKGLDDARKGLKATRKEGGAAQEAIEGLGRSSRRTGKKLKDTGRDAKSLNEQVRDVAKKAGTAAVAYLGFSRALDLTRRGARFMTDETKKLDTAMTQVRTISDRVGANFDELTDKVQALSFSIPKTPDDLGMGLYQTLSAGFADASDAADVLTSSAMLAAAGLLDTNTSVDAVTTMMNAYGIEAARASEVTDLFFTIVEQGKINVPQLAQNIGNVATNAALAGLDMNELGAAIATMTKFGRNSAETMTSLARFLDALINPQEATIEGAKALGVEFNLTALRSKGLTGLLGDLHEATGGTAEALTQLGLDTRAARSLFTLAGNGADEFNRVLVTMEEKAGATERALGKVNESIEAQEQLLKNRLIVRFQDLGERVLPQVLELMNKVFPQNFDERLAEMQRLGLSDSFIAGEVRRRRTGEIEARLGEIQRTVGGRSAESFLADLNRRIAQADREVQQAHARMVRLEAQRDREAAGSRGRASDGTLVQLDLAQKEFGDATRFLQTLREQNELLEERKQLQEELLEIRRSAFLDRARGPLGGDGSVRNVESQLEEALPDAPARVFATLGDDAKEKLPAVSEFVQKIEDLRELLDIIGDKPPPLPEPQGSDGVGPDGLTPAQRREAAEEAQRNADDQRRRDQERVERLREINREIQLIGNGILDGISGLVGFNRELEVSLRAAMNLSNSVISMMTDGFSAGGLIGAVGAGAGLLGTLVQNPEDAAERRRLREAIQELGEAARDLREAAVVGQDVNPGDIGEVRAFLEAWSSGATMGLEQFLDAASALNRIGRAIGREGLGNELIAAGEAGETQLDAFLSGLEGLLGELVNVGSINLDTLAGQWEYFRLQIEQLDLTDANQQLAIFSDTVLGMAPGLRDALAGFDLTTAEGRAAADQFVAGLASMLANQGAAAPDLVGLFGNRSGAEMLEILSQLDRFLDEMSGSAGDTQQFNRNVQVTEATSGRMLALQTTVADRMDRLVDLTETQTRIWEAVAAAQGVALTQSALPAASVVDLSGLVVHVAMSTAEPVSMQSPQSLEAAGARIGHGILRQLDQGLADNQVRSNRIAGVS